MLHAVLIGSGSSRGRRRATLYFRLWRLAFSRLRYLCFDIFLRRFLIREPMPTSEGTKRKTVSLPGLRS